MPALDQVRALHDAVQDLRRRRDELQTVEQAARAYQDLVAADTAVVAELRGRRDDLEREWLRRTAWAESHEAEPLPPPAGADTLNPRTASQEVARPAERKPATTSELRRHLGRLVVQFQYKWKLDAALLGKVNCIVEDDDRPLGEALALLPWRVFVERGRDTEAAHARRLDDWHAALEEYCGQVEGDIDMLETRFRHCWGIWELWRAREGEEGRQRWDAFIAQYRRTLGEDAARLRHEILDLEARLRVPGGQS